MKALGLAAVFAVSGQVALAEMRNEAHQVADKVVRISVVGVSEVLTVGPSDKGQVQVLSAADVEIVALARDAGSVALLGEPALVVEATGTHSCEEGDARGYFVVTLGDVPAAQGPVTTCAELTVDVVSGMITLEADPLSDTGEFWAWAPEKGWGSQLD